MVYAAAYERRRKIWGHLAGGPNSGIYKSTDGGENWRRITAGLPGGDVGKIGLAVTPANPEAVYATMEANDEERGFYRSLDKGESWERRNSYISGGTGPHYYQEIEASPHDADVVYQMDVFIQVTRDGGATFGNLETRATSTATTTPSGSIRRTRCTSSSARMPVCTRASTTAAPSGTSRTCPSRSSTS